MTTRMTAVSAVVVVVVLIGAFAIGALANGGDSTVACSSGQWVHATVTTNGEKLTVDNRKQLPKGYSATTESGGQKITVNSDGSVEAEGGAVTVECVTPTH